MFLWPSSGLVFFLGGILKVSQTVWPFSLAQKKSSDHLAEIAIKTRPKNVGIVSEIQSCRFDKTVSCWKSQNGKREHFFSKMDIIWWLCLFLDLFRSIINTGEICDRRPCMSPTHTEDSGIRKKYDLSFYLKISPFKTDNNTPRHTKMKTNKQSWEKKQLD